jgi:hypothetical protein
MSLKERDLLGDVQTDPPRQQPGTTEIQRQAAPREDLREPRVGAGNHQIASERHVAAGADRDAANLGDGRLGQAVQRQRHVADVAHVRQAVRWRPVVRPLPQVSTSAELAAGTRDHHDPVVAALGDLAQGDLELGPELHRRRVLLRRPVQRDRDDTVVTGDLDGLHARRRY